MCIRGTCQTCDKVSWWGCSKHVPAVMDQVPSEERYVSLLALFILAYPVLCSIHVPLEEIHNLLQIFVPNLLTRFTYSPLRDSSFLRAISSGPPPTCWFLFRHTTLMIVPCSLQMYCKPTIQREGKTYPPMAKKADYLPGWATGVARRLGLLWAEEPQASDK